MITVGLDFGTHQTKVCIENKDGVELDYTFMKFVDTYFREHYTFPSIIGVGEDGLLSYGFLPRNYDGRIIRYFKQSTFRPDSSGMSQINSMYFSTWYLAYILFDLEDKYGQTFTIQMGAPTDNEHIHQVKEIATRIITSAYKLVEDVFANDKEKFLATPLKELTLLTELVPYSNEIKKEYGVLVFPEAYACLMPIISQGKLEQGMNLMIDIGGGTTDISFFTIEPEDKNKPKENFKPQVYEFFSINKGLNYLTCSDINNIKDIDVRVNNTFEIDSSRKAIFMAEIDRICDYLSNRLYEEFKIQCDMEVQSLWNALKNRPLVYCGGGSTFVTLRAKHREYTDTRQISQREWNVKCIKDIDDIIDLKLCPILSTAYGLAISTENDNIKRKPFKDLFDNIRKQKEQKLKKTNHITGFGSAYGGFSYADDWDAWK